MKTNLFRVSQRQFYDGYHIAMTASINIFHISWNVVHFFEIKEIKDNLGDLFNVGISSGLKDAEISPV